MDSIDRLQAEAAKYIEPKNKVLSDPKKKALVERIMRQPKSIFFDNDDVIAKIKEEFTDKETIQLILKWYVKRVDEISKKAALFRDNILRRYSYLPEYKLMKKAKKYADALNFSDAEFNMFKEMFKLNYTSPLDPTNVSVDGSYSQTDFGKLFNIKPPKKYGELILQSEDEKKIIEKMIVDYKSSEELYYMVFLNSIKYQDCDLNLYKDIPVEPKITFNDCVNPVIAAMFIPKIPYFESRFIMQSIGKLVKDCYEHKELKGYLKKLRDIIILDKSQFNDQSGKSLSAVKDLSLRANIQYNVWWQISCLRNRKFLRTNGEKFYKALNEYAPDMFTEKNVMFDQNSIGVIRRLYNALTVQTITAVRKKTDRPFEGLKQYYDVSDNSKVPFIIVNDGKGNLEVKSIKKNSETVFTHEDKVYTDFQFIYVRPGENNNITSIIEYGSNVDLKTADDLPYQDYSISYSTATGVITVIVLRNTNIKDKNIKLNGEIVFNMDSFDTEIDVKPVIYDPTVHCGGKEFQLRSVVLTSINDIKTMNDDKSMKLRGNPYAIIFPKDQSKALLYSPYNTNKFYEGQRSAPITLIDDNEAKQACSMYSEIFIYANEENGLTN